MNKQRLILAVLLLLTGTGQALAALPAGGAWTIARYVPTLKNVGYGVAGNFFYDQARNVWTWTTPNTRNGTITVSPALVVESSSRRTEHWYDNQHVGGSSGSAIHEDREFGRFDLTIQQITWDPEAEEFIVGHSHRYYGGSFQTSWGIYMTARKNPDGGWASGGWHLVRGETEKSSVTHALESRASVGDFTLSAIGDPGYKATLHYLRSNMRYQGGGSWRFLPDTKLHKLTRNLSAVRDDRSVVDLVDPNTKLTSATVTGGSRLRWVIKSVPVEVVLQRQTYTFDQKNLRIPGPIEEDRQQTNAPVWDIEQSLTN
jgi:hypothetical protein